MKAKEMTPRLSSMATCVLAAAILALAALSARATDFTWDGNFSELWDRNSGPPARRTNWDPQGMTGPIPNADDNVFFGPIDADRTTVDLNGSRTVLSATFSGSENYTLTESTDKLTLDTGTITASGSATHTITSQVGLGADGVWAINNPEFWVNGVVSGAFALTKTGSGTLRLTGSNTYSGGTMIDGGTLLANNTSGSATGSGAVQINSGGTLGGTGSVAGAVTANAGSTIAPGLSAGTLTAGSDLTFGGTYQCEIDGATADRLDVAGTLDITNGILDIVVLGGATQPVYIIAGYGALNGSQFADVTGLRAGASIDYAYDDGSGSNHIALINWPTSPIHYYVATNGTAVWPYTNWATAATSIQDAVGAAIGGDMIWVTNGVYDTGEAEVYGMSNRVALTKAVTVQSVNGPDYTFIVGAADPVSTNGPAAVRCAYVTNGAFIAGFTLTNGHTHTSGGSRKMQSGGGVWLDGGGTVSNCTISGNSADDYGGGALCLNGGTLNNCTISGNSAYSAGGVHYYKDGTLNNCAISGNSALSAGGVWLEGGGTLNNCTISGNSAISYNSGGVYCSYKGTLNNCTLSGNSAAMRGGGMSSWEGGTLNNCILWGNTAGSSGDNWYKASGGVSFINACTTPTVGVNCVTNDPQFVSGSDFRLLYGSPCIDAGTNLSPTITNDIAGTPRPLDGDFDTIAQFDIGAYEYNPQAQDSDGDGHIDADELIAGTDPNDPNSVFRITDVSPASSNIVLRWRSASNRTYSLWGSSNLLSNVWWFIEGGITSTPPDNVHTVTPSTAESEFYLIEVE